MICKECKNEVTPIIQKGGEGRYILELCPLCMYIIKHTSTSKDNKVKNNNKKSTSKKDDKIVIKEQLNVEMPVSRKIDIDVDIIYNEKNEITMSKMKDNSVDYIFTSPPYNFFNTISNKKGESTKMYKNYDASNEQNLTQQKYYEWQVALIKEMLRVTKNHVFYNNQLITNNKIALLTLLDYFKYDCKEILIWHKRVSAPGTLKGLFNSTFEVIIVFSNVTPLERSFKDANFHGTESNVIDVHKTTNKLVYLNKAVFPINLPRKFMLMFGNEGDIWYDPFGGTGTTGVACVMTKRHYILSEMDKYQVKEANKRIKQYKDSPEIW